MMLKSICYCLGIGLLSSCSKSYTIPLSTNAVVFTNQCDSTIVKSLEGYVFSPGVDVKTEEGEYVYDVDTVKHIRRETHGWLTVETEIISGWLPVSEVLIIAEENTTGDWRIGKVILHNPGPMYGHAEIEVIQEK